MRTNTLRTGARSCRRQSVVLRGSWRGNSSAWRDNSSNLQAFTRHCTLWLSCTAHKTNDHQWSTKYAHTATCTQQLWGAARVLTKATCVATVAIRRTTNEHTQPCASSNDMCIREAEALSNAEPPLVATRTVFLTKKFPSRSQAARVRRSSCYLQPAAIQKSQRRTRKPCNNSNERWIRKA